MDAILLTVQGRQATLFMQWYVRPRDRPQICFRRLFRFSDLIARTAAALRILDQDTFFDEVQNVAECGVLRALCELCPFGRRELPLKTVKQTLQDDALSFVQRKLFHPLPKT